MAPRLAVLLLLAASSGVVAGLVGQATAGKKPAQAPAARRTAIFGKCPIPARFRPAFVSAANETHLPLAMLAAVANVESAFDPNARSAAGADGLLQVLPSTARALRLDVSTPAANVLAGARYLRQLLDRFQSTELALAAYNAGPTAVAKSGGAPNATSLAYVDEVTRLWRSLNGCR